MCLLVYRYVTVILPLFMWWKSLSFAGADELEFVVIKPFPTTNNRPVQVDDELEGSIECYAQMSTRGTGSAVKSLLHPQDCCRQAVMALMHMVNTSATTRSRRRSGETLDNPLQLQWQQECRKTVVTFFPTRIPKSEQQHPQRIPHFMAVVTLSAGASTTSLWKHETILVWDVQKEQGQNREERELFFSHEEYRLQSTLAALGGMHRRLDHQVHFLDTTTTNNNNNNNKDTSRTRCIDIPMYFPAGIFVNIEDLLRTKTTSSHNNVVIKLREPFPIIDQEEPSFASRPFGLVVYLCQHFSSVTTTTTTTTTKDETNADDVVSFAMELHSRYPKPCEKNIVPTNHLFFNDQMGYTMVRWRLSDNVVLEYNHVACPNGDDYPAIVVLSVMVSLLGAGVTLRNIAAVSQWI